MRQSPYKDARRVFWVMDNGSSHRGDASVQRLTQAHPRVVPVHGPVHASWLNQIEIYFSIVQRKALTPNDFTCRAAVAERLENFERYFESIARPLRVEIYPRRPERSDRAHALTLRRNPASEIGRLKIRARTSETDY